MPDEDDLAEGAALSSAGDAVAMLLFSLVRADGTYLQDVLGPSVVTALGIGIGVGAVSAAVVGYLCVQRSGLYFIMLTFALNQMFYFTAYQWTTVTGGEDGMPGIPRPSVLGLDIHSPLAYYAAVALFFLISLWVMKRIVESPLGKILRLNDDGSAPKDNPFVGRSGQMFDATPPGWSFATTTAGTGSCAPP